MKEQTPSLMKAWRQLRTFLSGASSGKAIGPTNQSENVYARTRIDNMQNSPLKDSTRLTAVLVLLVVGNLSAATHYLSVESANPTPPYTDFTT